jgi:Protein of unknown function (DUF1569)
MPVDTKKVEGRRKLAYKSLDELLADAERIGSGPVKTLGNWTPGQIFRHLARSYNASIDGFDVKFPWFLRTTARLFKNKLINGPMPPGYGMPPDVAKVMAPGETSTEEGLTDLRAAIARLKQDARRVKNPVLGEITREEWDKVHLSHASLHMSFLVPE